MTVPALIMAGGKGSRFKFNVEKPLALFLGKPLIDWVMDAVKSSNKVSEFFVVTSPNTLETERRCLEKGVKVIRTDGRDYHHDLKQAIVKNRLYCPVLVVSSDLPALTGNFIDMVISIYEKCGKPALTVLAPMWKVREVGLTSESGYEYGGNIYAVSGINVIDGSRIFEEEMEQEVLVSDSIEAILNINSLDDLIIGEKYMKLGKAGSH
ncbi:MAG: NTP transferase domain-containing protein [Nitrososphaerota archaeon]|nr:NTP transferase domain-containing protein [Candidatus Bathyarchaeota archaeon]MDW8194167.1 NTP transferase domain-containing protein [Nitrososphaerota archaeon]